jgi:drug/metabolite transporter (DMT)-like permease
MSGAGRRAAAPLPPLGVLALGVLAVSTGAIFVRLAAAPALATAAYRVGLATLALAPLALARTRPELKRLSAGDGMLAVAAGACLALHFATWIASLDYTSIANSVVLVNTNPLWVGLLAPLVTHDAVPRRTLAGILLSMAGAAVIGWGDLATGTDALYGDLLALAGGLCAALYLMLGRKLRRRLSLLAYILACYGSAAVFLLAAALLQGVPLGGYGLRTWAALAAMALFSQLVGHTSFNYALRWVRPSTVAVSLLGEPVGATLLGYLIFGEALTPTRILGGGLVLTAIYWVARDERRSAADAPGATPGT